MSGDPVLTVARTTNGSSSLALIGYPDGSIELLADEGLSVPLTLGDLYWLVVAGGPAAITFTRSHGAPGEHDGRPEQGDIASRVATSVTAGSGSPHPPGCPEPATLPTAAPTTPYGRLFTEADVDLILMQASRLRSRGRDLSCKFVVETMEGSQASPAPTLTFPADEPLFLLRGSDSNALEGLRHYSESFNYLDQKEHVDAVEDEMISMRRWQEAHPDRVKVPT